MGAVEEPIRTDVAVVGAGAAGLYAALVAAREGARVALVSRSPLAQTASFWAQGGIAAALAEDDSPELHATDTLLAGRELARASAVRVLCENSPGSVRDLQRLGVQFDADRAGNLALGLEGGHSRRRIVHAGGSATGRRITRDLSAIAATDERVTVLATGGMAALWSRTTNPRGAIGGGLRLADAAGARLADLEFMQFHPTALRHDGPRDGFLITEAVRGEGAKLLNPAGERFVEELAPRDQVALAIQAELDSSGAPAVGLDMRALDLGRFPNIAAALAEVGIDPARELVPVAPAAHYTMGGVAADLDGASTLAGLYAVGECACTGLHGANRLASNSLAECFVFGRRAGLAATADPEPPADAEPAEPAAPPLPPDETRAALWSDAGLLRAPERLRALREDRYPLARLIAASCLAREESRGAHQRVDHPQRDPALDGMHTLVGAGREPAFEQWE
jgi:L-aspartate oxidase